MSEIKVNKISPRAACGTVQLGDSGDTFTIPSGATINNQGTASGFGSTGEVSWVTTKKTTTFTVTSGEGYFCDTSSGGFTVNLPAGTAGASFAVADYTNTFQTGNLTISPNGSQKIGGIAADVVLSTEGQSAYFVYVDDTEGWKNVIDSTSNITGNPFIVATGGTETTCGNDKIHTFTGPGTFTVSQVHPCAANNQVSYMVVAGGGGGGCAGGGGGGGGGYREDKSPVTPYTASPLDGAGNISVTATAFPITVGAGGAAGTPGTPATGSSGADSVFSTITSAGGGGGGSRSGGASPSPSVRDGLPGGSGGGGGGTCGPNPNPAGGSGNTPPVSPPQGNGGGTGINSGNHQGGGGGGAGGAGSPGNNSPDTGGPGGAGVTTSINNSAVARAGGGGGGNQGPTAGTGGSGGGGNGGLPGSDATAGTDNTGGGGGGSGFRPSQSAKNGGSGIVIIRYKFQQLNGN